MRSPNISSMYRWVNTFFSELPGGSQDFLQLARASDGEVLGWIDEAGILQGSLVPPMVAGARFLQGSGNDTSYTTSLGSFVDMDSTNLKTTITIPVGYILIISATANVSGAAAASYYLGIAVDEQIVNFISSNSTEEATQGGLYSFSSCFVGDGGSHTVSLQFASNSGESSLTVDNYSALGPLPATGPRRLAPTLTLILAPSV